MLNTVDVVSRLRMFGYDVIDDDVTLIDYSCQSMEQRICNYCNVKEPPDELLFIATDAVCAEILRLKLIKGELPNIDDVLKAITSIKEGDVQISYTGNDTAYKQLTLILDAMDLKPSILNKFRKMVW